MNKLLILLLFISFDFNDQDIKGVDFKKHLITQKNSFLVYWKKDTTLFTGVAIEYYKNGILSSSKTYKNGEKDELWREWYRNGQLKWAGTYKDEKEDGLWRGWYENGKLESEGSYKDGKWDGLWKGWYENGNKRGEWNWKNGEWDGLQRHWHENGQLWFEINSKNGEEISKKCWDENGNVKECK